MMSEQKYKLYVRVCMNNMQQSAATVAVQSIEQKKNIRNEIFGAIQILLILYEFIPPNGKANIGLED